MKHPDILPTACHLDVIYPCFNIKVLLTGVIPIILLGLYAKRVGFIGIKGYTFRVYIFSHLKEKIGKLSNDLIGFSRCSASVWRIHVVLFVTGGP